MKITASELKNGIIEIDTIDKNDLRTAELSYDGRTDRFTIWFNGQLIHGSKTFRPVLNRLVKLNKDFPLDFSKVDGLVTAQLSDGIINKA